MILNLMFFQTNYGIPLELGRFPTEEEEEVNGANLRGVTGGQQQKLSPPTPFADTNSSFSEQTGEQPGEISLDATGMLSSRVAGSLPNTIHHFSPVGTSCGPGEIQEN